MKEEKAPSQLLRFFVENLIDVFCNLSDIKIGSSTLFRSYVDKLHFVIQTMINQAVQKAIAELMTSDFFPNMMDDKIVEYGNLNSENIEAVIIKVKKLEDTLHQFMAEQRENELTVVRSDNPKEWYYIKWQSSIFHVMKQTHIEGSINDDPVFGTPVYRTALDYLENIDSHRKAVDVSRERLYLKDLEDLCSIVNNHLKTVYDAKSGYEANMALDSNFTDFVFSKPYLKMTDLLEDK